MVRIEFEADIKNQQLTSAKNKQLNDPDFNDRQGKIIRI
jgi:hypothetical protein